jgi:hypothetical protein
MQILSTIIQILARPVPDIRQDLRNFAPEGRSYAGVAGGKLLPARCQPTASAQEILMEARTVNNLPPARADDGAVRCVFAIELSKTSWIVAVNTPLSDKVSRRTLKPCDGKGLLNLVQRG